MLCSLEKQLNLESSHLFEISIPSASTKGDAMFHKSYVHLYLLNALMLISTLHASLPQVKQNQPRDAFAWQNEKHHRETIRKFSLLAK